MIMIMIINMGKGTAYIPDQCNIIIRLYFSLSVPKYVSHCTIKLINISVLSEVLFTTYVSR